MLTLKDPVPLYKSHTESQEALPYHDEPPDCEAEGEPDADGVDDDAEVGVEPDDGRPEKQQRYWLNFFDSSGFGNMMIRVNWRL